jgi:quercetin dioxygenase-like cupin family protein
MPKGYRIAPHTHPGDENLTVLSGSMHVGTGAKFDTKKGDALKAGAFVRVGKGMQHYVWTTAPTVVQVHGTGPFAITYVNAADDPRNKEKAAKK